MSAYKHLTETRAKDRKTMAESIATMSRNLGATADIVEFGPRSIMVEIETPQGLCVGIEFDGDTPQAKPDTYVIPWNMRGTSKMAPEVFDYNVNPHHGQKATLVRHGFVDLSMHVSDVLEAARTGRAFVSP